ncbi:MAG: endolytic transglycosylase MltG [Pseudomonadales bacterium]|nr:endolytic transglycosylase MltG [Pseudomonadales bacterium]
MKNKINTKIAMFFLSIIILLILTLFYFFYLLQPLSSDVTETKRFIIPKGQAISVIAKRLKEENLIRSAQAFRYVVIRDNLAKNIQAGSFDISPNMSVSEIAKLLTIGTEDIWITLLEGWRAEEIAESLSLQNLSNFNNEEFLSLAIKSEGMLYPDTYLIPREISAEQIYNLLISTFKRKITQGLSEEFEQVDRDFDQVLILASILEREANNYEQMRRVAGILLNRIDIGMALQVDATLQYAKGYNEAQQTWWAPPTVEDKIIKSPYNTYINSGLPPAPISNPGLNAINAALNPIESDDLFYIHSNDGNMYYSKTLDGHNANINKYLR